MSGLRRCGSSTLLAMGACVLALTVGMQGTARAGEVAEEILYEEDFNDGQAQGWDLEGGWTVSGGMLRGQGHFWARPEVGAWRDFRLQFRLKLEQGHVHLICRLNDAGRYFMGFHQFGSYLKKQYWPGTFLDLLDQPVAPRGLGYWHEIEILAVGPRLEFRVDGELEWEYVDAEPLGAGGFAFETLDDGVVFIDDVRVLAPPRDTTLGWVRTGGPLGGLGYDVRMRPDNPDMMYVTDAWAGVFISDDGGRFWHPSNQGITTRAGESGDAIPVFCLTIDPHDYDTIWIGTQNTRGIFKSTDGGRTWTEKDQGVVEFAGITFRGFTVDPRSSDIVYAAAEISSYAWSNQEVQGREFDKTKGVVYRTTDGGEHWTAIWRGDNLARYVWIDPDNADVLYISTGIFDREAANSDHTTNTPGGEGVVKSTDGGQTWQRVNTGLDNLYVGTLFMHPENADVLLAGTGNNAYPENGGIYLTTNGGASWQSVLSDDNINAVEFAVSDPRIAYAGSAAHVYRSADTGRTWARVSASADGWGSPGVRAGFPIDFQVDPRDPNRVFANNYGGGNFLTTDGGRTWTVASAGYTGAQVRAIAIDPTDAGTVYAAARSGLFATRDGAQSWIGLSTPPAFNLEWNAVAVDPLNPQHLLAGNNWDPVILRSTDGGQTWQQTAQRLGDGKGWRAMAFAPSDSQIAYAGGSAYFSAGTFDDTMAAGGIYTSRDGGVSWAAANDAVSATANVADLAIDPANPQMVYAAATNDGLLMSSNAGAAWTKANLGPNVSAGALSVAVHPSEPDVVYVGLLRGGLYRSDDGGATWQLSMNGMPAEPRLADIVFDPTNAAVMYAADSFSGVYRSSDGGRSWRQINTSLRTRAVHALAISSDGGHLYAATEGEGVYRLDRDGMPPDVADAGGQ